MPLWISETVRVSMFFLAKPILSSCDQINICTRRSQSEVGVSTICEERQSAKLIPRIALDDRIDELADLVREHYGLAELGDPSTSTDVGHFVQFPRYIYRFLLGRSRCSWSYSA
jgi:hypothetical protein